MSIAGSVVRDNGQAATNSGIYPAANSGVSGTSQNPRPVRQNSNMDANKKQYLTDLLAKIQETLKADGAVIVGTHLRSTQYDKRHVEWFKQDASGSLYVRRGNKWDCIDYCQFRFGHRLAA